MDARSDVEVAGSPRPAGSYRIVGIDLGLTSTGWACECGTGAIRLKSTGMVRIDAIVAALMDHVRGLCSLREGAPVQWCRTVIEGYAFNSKQATHAFAKGELGGVFRWHLWSDGKHYAEVPPAVLKMFTLGKGGGEATGKDAMLAAAIRKFGFAGIDNNEADAWMLRCMGLARYSPLDMGDAWAPTQPQVRALERVEWPDA